MGLLGHLGGCFGVSWRVLELIGDQWRVFNEFPGELVGWMGAACLVLSCLILLCLEVCRMAKVFRYISMWPTYGRVMSVWFKLTALSSNPIICVDGTLGVTESPKRRQLMDCFANSSLV